MTQANSDARQPLPVMDLAKFQKSQARMIATNDSAYSSSFRRQYRTRVKDYTPEEINRIIDSGSLVEQQKLSRNYFAKDGYYRQIIIHYATLLKYAGVTIPNPSYGKSLSTPHISKRYYQAVDYVEKMNLPSVLTNCALRALTDGSYFGIVLQNDKQGFVLMDLPVGYCCSNFKDFAGNDVIEFDITYFNTIFDEEVREEVLSLYPPVVVRAYRRWQKGKRTSKWVIIPGEVGVCFSLFDGRPLFLNVIPATIEYDKAVETEQERDAEEIRKIIVQKIPHLTDGRLLFEPEEAEEIHTGTVGMLKGNKNVSVLTTYADVDAIVSKTASDASNNTLERMMKNIYAQAGTSSEIFAATGSSTLPTSIRNDIAMMMYLANKFSNFVSYAVNNVYANGNISFKYQILPVSYHNEKDYVELAYKLANSGYSWLMPAVAMGLSQKDLPNLKDLENEVLDLSDKLRPLSSAYTQNGANGTGNPVGRPKLADEDKSDKTLKNETSIDNQTVTKTTTTTTQEGDS